MKCYLKWVFDAFEIIKKIEEERNHLDGYKVESNSSVTSNQGFAEVRAK